MTLPRTTDRWHIDRTINVSVIVALAANICVGIWVAAKFDARVTAVEQWQKLRETDRETLVRIDERTRAMAEDISSLKRAPNLRVGP